MSRRSLSRTLRDRTIATLVAAAVHGVMFWALIATPGSDYPPVAYPGAMSVDLMGRGFAGGGAPPPPPPEPPAIEESLAQEIRREMAQSVTPPPQEKPRSKATSLTELFGESEGPPRETGDKGDDASIKGLAQMAAGRLGDPRAQASTPRPVRFDGDGSVLPCWQKPERRLPVRMVVVLDARGALIGRPVINRGAGSPNGAAEAEALRAMSGCSPYAISYNTHPPGAPAASTWE